MLNKFTARVRQNCQLHLDRNKFSYRRSDYMASGVIW